MKLAEFGEKLKELRLKSGEIQPQLAKELGIGLRQIQRYEKGEVPIVDKIEQLCLHYNYDFFRLLSDKIFPRGNIESDTSELARAWKEAAEANKIARERQEKITELQLQLQKIISESQSQQKKAGSFT
jgi:transcriptional regulator with XRE-family HTH domain